MKVTMTHSRWGSTDGFDVKQYKEGETYEMSDMLARAFIRSHVAYEAGTTPEVIEPVASPFGFRFPEIVKG